MVKALIDSLLKSAHNEKRIFLVMDDLEIYGVLAKYYPDTTINMGISECNAVSVAAGLANVGFKVYIVGGNTFMAYRAYEFIRVQLCMQNLNVTIIGIGAGLAIGGYNGMTHEATEDVSILRALPNLKVITPATPYAVRKTIEYIDGVNGPAFIRIGRQTEKDFYINKCVWKYGKITNVKKGKELVVLATGTIVSVALQVAEQIKEYNIGVVDVHTIKPLDIQGLILLSKKYGYWITLEEHNIMGGLFGAISEAVISNNLNVCVDNIGLNDVFASGYGNYEEIKSKNGLGENAIRDKIYECLTKKNV